MCGICGCGGEASHSHSRTHGNEDGHAHGHDHENGARLLKVEQDLLAKNDAYAARNRRFFEERGVFAVNLVSSPGSGKTTLLARSVAALRETMPVAVIEGDQQTELDAERIRAAGAPAIQVNTGKGCHLDAHMVGHAVEELGLAPGTALFIENVGNLVCPSAFDLGEAHKVVILSVTEGEDKPLKYPDMFAASDLMLLSKADLLPHLRFDAARCLGFARRVNPRIEFIRVSAESGEGLEEWHKWLAAGREAALHRRVALLGEALSEAQSFLTKG